MGKIAFRDIDIEQLQASLSADKDLSARTKENIEILVWLDSVWKEFRLHDLQKEQLEDVAIDHAEDENADETHTDYFLTLEHFTKAIVGIENCDETIREEYSKIDTIQDFVSFAKDNPECIDESLLPEGIHVDNSMEIAMDFGVFWARS